MIAKKLGVQPFTGKASNVPPPRMTSLTGEVVFDYSGYNGRYVIGSGVLAFETQWTKASNTRIHVYSDPAPIHSVAICRGAESISQVQCAEVLDYTSSTRTAALGNIIVYRNVNGFYSAIQVKAIKDTSRDDNKDEVRFRYAIQANGSDDFTEFIGI